MEPQKYARQMQEEMISEIERANPKYSGVRCNERFLVATARIGSANLHLGK